MERLAVHLNQVIMLTWDALVAIRRVYVFKNYAILLYDRLAHEDEELRRNPKVLGKSYKHFRLRFTHGTQRHVRREDLPAMDNHVGPSRIGQNKLVEILGRVKTKEPGRNSILVRDIIKLYGISFVNYIRWPLRGAPKSERVGVDPRSMARVYAVLDDQLGRLLDGRLKPGSIEPKISHVWNIRRLRTLKANWTDPQKSILFPRVEFIN